MRNKAIAVFALVAVMTIASIFVWNYLNYLDYLKEIHNTLVLRGKHMEPEVQLVEKYARARARAGQLDG